MTESGAKTDVSGPLAAEREFTDGCPHYEAFIDRVEWVVEQMRRVAQVFEDLDGEPWAVNILRIWAGALEGKDG